MHVLGLSMVRAELGPPRKPRRNVEQVVDFSSVPTGELVEPALGLRAETGCRAVGAGEFHPQNEAPSSAAMRCPSPVSTLQPSAPERNAQPPVASTTAPAVTAPRLVVVLQLDTGRPHHDAVVILSGVSALGCGRATSTPARFTRCRINRMYCGPCKLLRRTPPCPYARRLGRGIPPAGQLIDTLRQVCSKDALHPGPLREVSALAVSRCSHAGLPSRTLGRDVPEVVAAGCGCTAAAAPSLVRKYDARSPGCGRGHGSPGTGRTTTENQHPDAGGDRHRAARAAAHARSDSGARHARPPDATQDPTSKGAAASCWETRKSSVVCAVVTSVGVMAGFPNSEAG